MYQTLITVLRYSITYYQKDLFICTHYANKHKEELCIKPTGFLVYNFVSKSNLSQALLF